jgi:hypothetical protein
MREAADERLAVQRLELVQHRAVDEPGDHLADVVGLAQVLGDDAVQVGRVHHGSVGSATGQARVVDRFRFAAISRTSRRACSSSRAS